MFHYGKLIKDYRKRKQMTQKELAIVSDCSDSYISKMETGKIEPPNELLVKISEILEIKELQGDYTAAHILEEKLEEWHTAITDHQLPIADKLFNEIKPNIPIHRIELNTRYYIFLFRYFLLQFDHTKAKTLLPKIMSLTKTVYEPELYICYKSLGYYFILDHDYKNAFHYLQLALGLKESIDNEDPEIHIYFAIIYIFLNKPADAENEIFKAKHQYEKSIDPINNLLCKYLLTIPDIMLHKYDEAIVSLTNILEQSSHHTLQIKYEFIYVTLGYIYTELKDFNKAVTLLKKAISAENIPSFKVKYLYFLAIVYAENGQKKEAIDYIQIGLRLKANEKYQHLLYMLKQIITDRLYSSHSLLYLQENMLPFFSSRGDRMQFNECHLMLAAIYRKMFQYKKASYHLYNVINDDFQLAELTEKYST
ncbi:TPR repeat-containing protein [Gracilibacillus ureilyticus]|uniref:TPR repeat-containing protein n=1 Tax=Gracilibacillus ureilyticus TaxID=531814 RepID=A0A1H9R855_9BACI|nr:helix-turn-helix transcriptional regulator [Gracilibacillus ureilyticus]SER68777.1 TPR repeat-containing protein [Gracilibacillus ureilyticus]